MVLSRVICILPKYDLFYFISIFYFILFFFFLCVCVCGGGGGGGWGWGGCVLWVILWAEETSAYSWSRFCTVNCQP